MSKFKTKKIIQKRKKLEKPSSVLGNDDNIHKETNCSEQQQSVIKPSNNSGQSFWESVQSFLKKEKNWEWTGVVINLTIAIFTMFLFYLTKEQADILKESLTPKVDIDTTNIAFNNNIEVREPKIIIKNFGNLIAKNVTISARADLRYADIPADSVSSYRIKNNTWNQIYAGDKKYLKIPLSSEDPVKSGDTRYLFLHFKITFQAFDDPVNNPVVGIKYIREGNRYEECEHNE